ncbi:cytochrome P450 2A13-like [Neosynchiropus ocellatus]
MREDIKVEDPWREMLKEQVRLLFYSSSVLDLRRPLLSEQRRGREQWKSQPQWPWLLVGPLDFLLSVTRFSSTARLLLKPFSSPESEQQQSSMELLTSAVLAGLILVLLWIMKDRAGPSRLPPGPTALPLVGNVLQLDKKFPFRTLVEMSSSYGPVMTLYLGWQRAVVLVGHDAVKEALVDQADDFTGRGPLPFLMKATRGYGLGVSNGERWRQLRRFTLSTLRDFGMGRKGMEEWTQEESKHLRDWIISLKGAVFNPTFLLGCTVANIVCCLVFGRRFDYDDKDFQNLLNTINEIVRFGSSPIGQLYNVFPRLLELLPGSHHKVFAQMLEIREFVNKEIQRHEETLDPSSPRDYIDCFLIRMKQEKDNPNTEFHQDNLVSSVMNLFLAGTETTSSTIRYGLSVMAKRPDIQAKVQQEIDSVIGDRTPNMEDRKSLPFTDAVIHEFQRFLDIVPLSLPHYTLHDVSFRGYIIPKDTVIIPLLHSVLKDVKHWETPQTFNPQHFLTKEGSFKKSSAFMPFAAGKRSCVGESLARMELFIFVVTLMQHFTVSCPGGPDSIDLVPEYSSFANIPRQYELSLKLRAK